MVTDVAEQVSACAPLVEIFGLPLFSVTFTVEELEQLFEGSVTVSVYVPAAETTVEALAGVVPAGTPLVGPVHA